VFDGDGDLTQRDYQGDNLAGPDFAPPGQKGNLYGQFRLHRQHVINLNAPVTSGSIGVISIKFVISNGGRHVHEVVSEFASAGCLRARDKSN
jgi:hypothetical protein